MKLNETQSAAVCQAYCAMITLTDAAYDLGLEPSCLITASGFLVFGAGGATKVLRHVKDRTPKEIDDFVKRCVDDLHARLQEEDKI